MEQVNKAEESDELANSLVRIDGNQLEAGDYVYEKVQWDREHPERVKFNKYRVMSVERGAVKCVRADGKKGQHAIKLSFNVLMMERKTGTFPERKLAVVPPPPRSEPPRAAVVNDDQFAAWLDMGRSLVNEVTREKQQLVEQRERLTRDLEAIDATHRRTIEQLERDLAKAKDAHASDRGLAVAGRDAIDAKLAHLNERIAGLQKMLSGAESPT